MHKFLMLTPFFCLLSMTPTMVACDSKESKSEDDDKDKDDDKDDDSKRDKDDDDSKRDKDDDDSKRDKDDDDSKREKGDEDLILGEWDCESGGDVNEDDVRMYINVEYENNFLVNGRYRSEGVFSMEFTDLGKTAEFNYQETGTYEFVSGQFCMTTNDVKTHATNRFAREIEQNIGGSFGDTIPTGSSDCSKYKLTKSRLTSTDDDGIETICRR